jgi:hypothetical protein
VVNVLTSSYDPGLFQHTSLHAEVTGRGTREGSEAQPVAVPSGQPTGPERGRPCPTLGPPGTYADYRSHPSLLIVAGSDSDVIFGIAALMTSEALSAASWSDSLVKWEYRSLVAELACPRQC